MSCTVGRDGVGLNSQAHRAGPQADREAGRPPRRSRREILMNRLFDQQAHVDSSRHRLTSTPFALAVGQRAVRALTARTPCPPARRWAELTRRQGTLAPRVSHQAPRSSPLRGYLDDLDHKQCGVTRANSSAPGHPTAEHQVRAGCRRSRADRLVDARAARTEVEPATPLGAYQDPVRASSSAQRSTPSRSSTSWVSGLGGGSWLRWVRGRGSRSYSRPCGSPGSSSTITVGATGTRLGWFVCTRERAQDASLVVAATCRGRAHRAAEARGRV